MTAAELQAIRPDEANELVRARFEALAEWNIPLDEARTIAERVDVDIVEAVRLLAIGCPARVVLPLLL